MSYLLSLLIPVVMAAPSYTVGYDACVFQILTGGSRPIDYSAIVVKSGGCKNGFHHVVPLNVCSTDWKAVKNGVNQVAVDKAAHC